MNNKPQQVKQKLSDDDKKFIQSPEVTNASIIDNFQKFNYNGKTLELIDVIDQLQSNTKELRENPLALSESMLISQAQSLNAIYSNMAVKACQQSRADVMNTLLKLALKAQSQCRATLETLAAIKNPPVVFAKQANIAHTQQVNNHHAQPDSTQNSEQSTQQSAQQQQSLEHTPSQAIPKVTAKSKAAKVRSKI